MSRQLLYSIALLGAALLIAALMIALKPAPVEEERIEQVPLVQAVPLKAASGPIPVLGSGAVQAREEVTVAAEVSGRLTYVHPAFREGGTVPAGATLVRVDERDYVNQVRVAEADVAAQKVAVMEAEEEVAIAREELARYAEREAGEAASGAGDTRILPPRAMEPQGAASASAARGGDSARRDGSDSAKRSLATRQPQLQSAKAARDRARANLADAQIRLARTRVTAPFTGLVRSETASVGQVVQPGEPLGTMVDAGAYEVRVALTADEAALIPGLLGSAAGRVPASVTASYGGKTYRWDAYVDRASAILDEATRNIEVFVQVPAPRTGGRLVGAGKEQSAGRAPPLLLGAFVKVEITGASLDSYARVPADAVRPGNLVWVVRDGRLAILSVEVIQRSDEFAYITTPSLGDGGLLVTSSLPAPIEGMSVRVAGSGEASAGKGAANKGGSGQ